MGKLFEIRLNLLVRAAEAIEALVVFDLSPFPSSLNYEHKRQSLGARLEHPTVLAVHGSAQPYVQKAPGTCDHACDTTEQHRSILGALNLREDNQSMRNREKPREVSTAILGVSDDGGAQYGTRAQNQGPQFLVNHISRRVWKMS